MSDIASLERKIYDLQSDVGKMNVLVVKFDSVIDKLSSVSNDISKLLAVQSARLEMQEKLGSSLSDTIEKRKSEVDSEINKLHNKVDSIESEIMKRLDRMAEKTDRQFEEQKCLINKVQKWMYIVLGGAMAVWAILTQLAPIIPKFLS